MAKLEKLSKTEWKKIQVQERKKLIAEKKAAALKLDGDISAKELERIRNAIREIWQWSSIARKNCIKRATDKNGFGHCEQCKKKVPKVYADHIEVMGSVLAPDYIKRMWSSSDTLQALCQNCHNKKTKLEREAAQSYCVTKQYKLFTDEN